MGKVMLLKAIVVLLPIQPVFAQECKTNADLDLMPGKYLTAAQYPWPAVKAEYFNKMTTATDKAMAKQVLGNLEKAEQQSRNGFTLTGGSWESYYSTEGYRYFGNARLGTYTFQTALYEFFCSKGRPVRNSEYSTVLRVYVNALPVNTMNRFLNNPYGSSIGEYDFNLQYMDWKNHKLTEPYDALITLFTYMSCANEQLIQTINSGNDYFQDTPAKDIRVNSYNHIYRYWFVKKNNLPVLLPVSRREYLNSLLEYYEREKLYFPKLIAKLTKENDKGVARYNHWERDVSDKIAIVEKAISGNNEEWLKAQAIINRVEDASLTYKAKLEEKTNNNRFWRFYGSDNKSEPLYQYNPEYFKASAPNQAKPQFVLIAFRYSTMPSSLRLLDNFTNNFDFDAVKKMMQ